VTQKLCRRLEELEKISAAAAAPRAPPTSDYKEKIAALVERANAWHAGPVNQKWLAEQPPDYLHNCVQSLRAKLQERSNRHLRQLQTGGFR
jgi:hypothetical protein